jgi:uncharacterized SAM-binding protein YcdF (DUF218 family)
MVRAKSRPPNIAMAPRLAQFQHRRSRKSRFPWLSILLSLTAFFGAYKYIRHTITPPEALLVLGGEPKREQFAAKFARQHPDLPIWVSGGSPKEYADWVFEQAGIDRQRVHLDYQAVDTLTNFTTLIERLKANHIHSVYLITSDDHMLRANLVGEIILGSQGIEIKPVAFPSGRKPEDPRKAIRDVARSLLWITTGDTGLRWIPELKHLSPN